VASERELQYVRELGRGSQRISVVPNAVDAALYRADFGPVEPDTLVFSGALSYRPNEDAMRYFSSEIFPRVLAALPNARLRITGARPARLSSLLEHPRVEHTGYVPDVRPIVAQSSAAIVPLRLGGGTRLKILEAMALGTPVVSTSKGAEGLAVTPGEDVLLADTPDSFAQAIIRVLGWPQLRQQLSKGGRRLVETRYDWARVGGELLRLLEDVSAEVAA
jgi:glycosyltransferase involved in cell wall biosynthesis